MGLPYNHVVRNGRSRPGSARLADDPTLARLPNEALVFASSGNVHFRGSGREGIAAGEVPILLGLATQPRVGYPKGSIVVHTTVSSLLAAAGYERLENGTFSRFQRQYVKHTLEHLAESGIVRLVGFSDKMRKFQVVLDPRYYGGLETGGQGFSLVRTNALFRLMRAALKPESKAARAIPLACFLARQQVRTPKGFLPQTTVRLRLEVLLGKLGLGKESKSRQMASLAKVLGLLVRYGALVEAPNLEGLGLQDCVELRKSPTVFNVPRTREQIRRQNQPKNPPLHRVGSKVETRGTFEHPYYARRASAPDTSRPTRTSQAEPVVCQASPQGSQAKPKFVQATQAAVVSLNQILTDQVATHTLV